MSWKQSSYSKSLHAPLFSLLLLPRLHSRICATVATKRIRATVTTWRIHVPPPSLRCAFSIPRYAPSSSAPTNSLPSRRCSAPHRSPCWHTFLAVRRRWHTLSATRHHRCTAHPSRAPGRRRALFLHALVSLARSRSRLDCSNLPQWPYRLPQRAEAVRTKVQDRKRTSTLA